ncbi:MAG: hypothetical protein A4E35_02207 [Methanoregula sp. PtaU1.Bin051]|nr:MAG: hypothetical protein A4E35_02207 [Methanoregula sp. PtaU1.Bin051]
MEPAGDSVVLTMDYGKLIGDSFAYAKDGLLGNVGIWIMLLILTILPVIPIFGWVFVMILSMNAAPGFLFLAGGIGIAIILAIILSAFYTGYMLKILRGETPLPPVVGFGTMFTDGIKYIVIQAIYMIPAIIIFCVTVLPAMLSMWTSVLAGHTRGEFTPAIMSMLGGILITVIVAFIFGLFAIIGVVRFARMGTMGEAFNLSAILAMIKKIGWVSYIIALLIMMIIVLVISIVLGIIPIIGGILQFIINPFIGVFTMRYICMLYDSAGTA